MSKNRPQTPQADGELRSMNQTEYDPPYSAEEVKRHYSKEVFRELVNDPCHRWRMQTGVELLHKEPTVQEFLRICQNWSLMPDRMKRESDKKSMELFGVSNWEHAVSLARQYGISSEAKELGSLKKSEVIRAFREVKAAYAELGFDVSYMKALVQKQPLHVDGSPSFDMNPKMCGGDWTRLGIVRLNPDVEEVAESYGINEPVEKLARSIAAHELSHEVYNRIATQGFIGSVLKKCQEEGFSTAYLETVPRRKLREETFCEYMAREASRVADANAQLGDPKPGARPAQSFVSRERRGMAEGPMAQRQSIAEANNEAAIREIRQSEVAAMLDAAEAWNENPRYSRKQFDKYLSPGRSSGKGKSVWLGCFSGGELKALAYLKKSPAAGSFPGLSSDFVCISEVQSLGKGYGKPLIQHAIDRFRNLWLAQDWKGGESLRKYYMQFGLKEAVIRNCVCNGRDINVFYKAQDEDDEEAFLRWLRTKEKKPAALRRGAARNPCAKAAATESIGSSR